MTSFENQKQKALLVGFGIKFSFLELLEWFGSSVSEFLIRKLEDYIPSEPVIKCIEDIRNGNWQEVDSSFLSYTLEEDEPSLEMTLQEFLSQHLDLPVTKLEMYPGTYFIGILSLNLGGEITMSEASFKNVVEIYRVNIQTKLESKVAGIKIPREPKLIISSTLHEENDL